LPDVRIDAWVTPPPYVNQAPVFLTGVARPQAEAVAAIEGSEITVRVGGAEVPRHRFPGMVERQAAIAPAMRTRLRGDPGRCIDLDLQAGLGRRV
jgi:hypothetical protein